MKQIITNIVTMGQNIEVSTSDEDHKDCLVLQLHGGCVVNLFYLVEERGCPDIDESRFINNKPARFEDVTFDVNQMLGAHLRKNGTHDLGSVMEKGITKLRETWGI